jgi:hypothetical protein
VAGHQAQEVVEQMLAAGGPPLAGQVVGDGLETTPTEGK